MKIWKSKSLSYWVRDKWLLLAVAGLTLVGLGLRLLFQAKIPYGFHRDEAGILYSAYSIARTGRDEWGRLLPLHFKALGDYPPGIYNYLTSLFVLMIGPVPLAERLPAIVLGSFLIPLTYVLVKQLFNQEKLALISAGLIVFNPWHWFQSRAGSEPIAALFFSLLGLFFYGRYLTKKKRPRFNLILTSLCYFLALYTYNAARMMLPLIHFLTSWYHQPDIFSRPFKLKEKNKKILLYSIGLVLFSVGAVFISSQTAMRLNTVSLLHQIRNQNFQAWFDREAINGLPIFFSRLMHNKPIELIRRIISNYFNHFRFGFLFGSDGKPSRYLVPSVGQFLWICLPLLLCGLIKPRIEKTGLKQRQKLFLVIWILTAPLAAAITYEDIPHVKRAMYLFWPLVIFAANGTWHLGRWLKQVQPRLIAVFTVLLAAGLFSWELLFTSSQYLIHAKYETIHHRSYGYKQAFDYLKRHKDSYQRVIVYEGTDTPYIFYLVYSQYPPRKYQQQAQANPANLFNENKTSWTLGKYEFRPGSCPLAEDLAAEEIYFTKYECRSDLKGLIEIKHQVRLPSGLPKYIIFESRL